MDELRLSDVIDALLEVEQQYGGDLVLGVQVFHKSITREIFFKSAKEMVIIKCPDGEEYDKVLVILADNNDDIRHLNN
jgi:hypothetical protein